MSKFKTFMWLLIGVFVIWLFMPDSAEKIEADRQAKELQDRQKGGYMTDEQKAKDDAYQKEKDERRVFKRRLNWALEHSKED